MLGLSKAPAAAALGTQWDTQSGSYVISLKWSPGASNLAVASADGPILILDAETGKRRHLFSGHKCGTESLAWNHGAGPCSGLLASCGHDGVVRVWNSTSSQELHTLEAGSDWVSRVAWSPNGRYLAASAGRKLSIWDCADSANTPVLVQRSPDQESTIADIAWKPGVDNTLASCAYNGLTFWSPLSAEPVKRFDWKGSMLALSWSPDAKYIATGNQDSTVQFWIIATGKELHMSGYVAKIRELAWDSRSRYLASGGSATIVVWDCSGKGPAGSKPYLLDYHSRLLTQLCYQPQGSLLASGCQEGLVAIWRPEKDQRPLATAHLGAHVTQLSWAASNKRLAAANSEGLVTMLRLP